MLTSSSEITGVTDRKHLYAFRIYIDHVSGCVRFEATPRRGPLKTVAIWTAFVTQYIGHKGWMTRVGTSKIQFGELHPYVFCDGYRVPKGNAGKYQLTFTSPEGTLIDLRLPFYGPNADTSDRREELPRQLLSHQDPISSTTTKSLACPPIDTPVFHELRPRLLMTERLHDDMMRAVSAFRHDIPL
jgi:hypothetical protein